MSSNFTGNILKHSGECCQTFLRMSSNILGMALIIPVNVAKEYKFSLIPLRIKIFMQTTLALKAFFINEICVLRKEVVSNKQYVDQVLADGNISSQTSKLIAKVELLEKENMEIIRK